MRTLILTILIAIGMLSHAQDSPKFNLDFERNTQSEELPDGWFKWGTFPLSIEQQVVHSGQYAAKIDSNDFDTGFGSIAYEIPAKYPGSHVTLEAYIKSEKVENGFVGLILRLDGDDQMLAFDNLQREQIKGTTEWKKYSTTLPLPEETKHILVAGILQGTGTAWFDDFRVLIDGKDIQTLKEDKKGIVVKAELDTEFDNGSGFDLKALSDSQASDLYKLGKVWGFLKYHHPKIAEGNLNWDYELIRMLPATGSADFNERLLQWMKKLDLIVAEAANPTAQTRQNFIEADIGWLRNRQLLSNELSEQLTRIVQQPKNEKHYYVTLQPRVKNPRFKNEKRYADMDFSDDGLKLVALFRYWNMIEYFFPYRHLTDEDWDSVLRAFIPRILAADDELSYKLALLALIGQVQDTHANIWQQDQVLSEFFGKNNLPIQVKFIEGQAVVVKTTLQLSDESKIKTGDVITHINGTRVEDIVNERIQYAPASNRPTQLRDVAAKLLRTNDDSLLLSLNDAGRTYQERVAALPRNRISFRNQNTPSHKVLDEDIGYIFPGSLQKDEIHQIMETFIDKKGLIVDLRTYPSDFIVFSLGKYLMPEPTEFAKFTSGSLRQPGTFAFGPTFKTGEDNPDYFKGPVVILIDETTQSQAEYTTMALRVAPNATVIGSTTAGADGNVSEIYLPGNIRTMISGIGVYYPDGRETQRVGIVPDIEMLPTIQGIRANKDELLDKAVALIRQ